LNILLLGLICYTDIKGLQTLAKISALILLSGCLSICYVELVFHQIYRCDSETAGQVTTEEGGEVVCPADRTSNIEKVAIVLILYTRNIAYMAQFWIQVTKYWLASNYLEGIMEHKQNVE